MVAVGIALSPVPRPAQWEGDATAVGLADGRRLAYRQPDRLDDRTVYSRVGRPSLQLFSVSNCAFCGLCFEPKPAQNPLSLRVNAVQAVEQPVAERVPECRGLG